MTTRTTTTTTTRRMGDCSFPFKLSIDARRSLLFLALFPSSSLHALRCEAQQAFLPTPAPTTTKSCTDEYSSWLGCLKGNSTSSGDIPADTDPCDRCYAVYVDAVSNDMPCDQVTTIICDQNAKCRGDCFDGRCDLQIEAYETGVWGPNCFGPCSATSPAASAAPAAPIAPSAPAAPSSPVSTASPSGDSGTSSGVAEAHRRLGSVTMTTVPWAAVAGTAVALAASIGLLL